jgi:hypothetical protein
MVLTAKDKYASHVAALEAETKPIRLALVAPNFAEAIKGKSKYANMQDAVDTMLAGSIITADQSAKDVREKLTWCKEHAAGHSALFPDLQQIITKPIEDFALTITSRIDKAKEAEEKRLAAEREKIRAEEQAKAQANARREAQEAAAKAESDRLAALPKEAPVEEPKTLIRVMDVNQAVAITDHLPDATKMIKLGEICNRLGFTVTADFLASLGFEVVATDKNAKLYKESSFPAICRALQRHINDVATGTVRLAA